MRLFSESQRGRSIAQLVLVVVALYLSSTYSYLLFHSLVEIVTVAVSFSLFMLTRNVNQYLTNGYLRVLGIGYGCVAVIDLLHTLAYKGMHVFPDHGANLPTQLWIAARYLQALMLLVAPSLITRRISTGAILAPCAVSVATLVLMIYKGHFPSCYVDGQGLTSFKIGSEYFITFLLLVALDLLRRRRSHFDPAVFTLLVCSIAGTAVSEISFASYVSVYGFANMLGHYAKLLAFYFMYRAVLVTGISRPFALVFRDLKLAEASLQKSEEDLEEKVRHRTDELRASEQRYRSLIQKVQTAIVLHDREGKILVVNPMAEQLLGLSEAQLLGKALLDPAWRFLRQDEAVLSVDEYPAARVLASGQALRRGVFGIRARENAEPTWVLVNAEPELDETGEIALVVVSFVDITDQKRSDEQLEARVAERTAQLEAANKELEAFAYSVSHDLRAPLRHVDGFLSLLKDSMGAAASAPSRRYMDMVSESSQRMGALIDDLLSFSRMGRTEVKQDTVDLRALADDIVRELESDVGSRDVVWRIGSLPVVMGDRSMLRLVLGNLLANALKFTRPRERAEIEIGCRTDRGRDIVFYVRDNGVGFDMRYADKLFGVFQRLHHQNDFEGTGIGLASVRRVIGRHGGRTWAEGAVDGGATFYFSLPKSGVRSVPQRKELHEAM